MSKFSWRVKLMMLFTLVLGTLLLFQLFYIIPYIQNREIEMTEVHQQEISRNIARELDIDLLRIKNRLMRLAERPEFLSMDTVKQYSTITQHVEISLLIYSLSVLDAEGWFVSSTGDDFSSHITRGYADRNFFALPFERGEVYFNPPRFYSQTGIVGNWSQCTN